ncbi:MAG: diaminopimelate epimerase [Oligoflexales bacterium]
MKFAFEKWHGCANDFIIFWVSRNDGDMILDVIRRKTSELCARGGGGVAADGVLVLHTESRDDVMPHRLTIFNADGSEAAACGNGTRCAAASILKRHQDRGVDLEHGFIQLLVKNRQLSCQLLPVKHSGGWPYVMVDMGSCIVETVETELSQRLKSSLSATSSCTVTVGNVHLVVFQDDEPSIQKLARANLQKVYQDTNVHLAQECEISDADNNQAHHILQACIKQKVKIQSWERGVGPTQACASGASAVCAAVMAEGFVPQGSWILIENPGGLLYCKQEEQNLIQVGPAVLSFEGVVSL